MKTPNLKSIFVTLRRTVCGALFLATVMLASASSIVGSKHDLSVTSTANIKAVSENNVCIFCHVSHHANGATPLWNHALSQAVYTPYDSTTVKATIGQPTGSSRLCLSCHDGTIALGMVSSKSSPIQMQNGVTTLPAGTNVMGTDLSDDHPVSFVYDNNLVQSVATDNRLTMKLKPSTALAYPVQLDQSGQLQCTACHDPHNNQFGKFMVMDNTASALCLKCHDSTGWSGSTHATSGKTWNGIGVNPWPATAYNTVAANGCENCHVPHAAGTHQRLLTQPVAEDNCYSCHDGNVAAKNLLPEFNKLSAHPIQLTSGIHDPTEDPVNGPRHVTCVDCHNPHSSTAAAVSAPNAGGPISGTIGVNSSGAIVNPIVNEYELCFRCHGDSLSRGPAYVNRQYVQTNTRLAFNAGNASFHPVTAPGKNVYVPSLIAPWTTASYVRCTDCHNNDSGPGAGGVGPKGPHGSAYSPILERQQILTDNSAESPVNYALCYKCHSRDSILSNVTFPFHSSHVVNDQAACTTCHDAHGVSTAQHLINFNVFYVSPSTSGRLSYVSTGMLHGNCTLTCHGKDHEAAAY
jgi:predicted CXXCH cytochrome family protein